MSEQQQQQQPQQQQKAPPAPQRPLPTRAQLESRKRELDRLTESLVRKLFAGKPGALARRIERVRRPWALGQLRQELLHDGRRLDQAEARRDG